ncbi:MAG: hypothetical protein AB9856_16875 [Cellulosilyticaceae bacterium]
MIKLNIFNRFILFIHIKLILGLVIIRFFPQIVNAYMFLSKKQLSMVGFVLSNIPIP